MASTSFQLAEGQVLLLLLPLLLSFITAREFASAGNYSSSFRPKETSKFWASKGRADYTFGFKDLGAGEYLLAIWHSRDLTQTPIWWAVDLDDNQPVIAKQAATFLYTSSGFLELLNSSSLTIWRSGNLNSSNSLQFVDTGNLQLMQDNNTLWETFLDHRNTLMLMSLEPSMLIDKPRLLQSTSNKTSYAKGRFHMATYRSFDVRLFGIDELNNQYVYMKDYNVSVNTSGPGGHISIGNQLDGTAYSSGNPSLEKLRLDYDGNLRVYRWFDINATWVSVWALLQDWSLHCRAGSPCGPFGICPADTEKSTIACTCPTGYTPISSSDDSKGCTTTRSPPGCGHPSAQNVIMVEQADADFYYNDLRWETGVYHLEDCKNLCLSECKCIAATYSGSVCFLKGNTTLGYLENGITAANSPILLMKLLELPADATPESSRHLVPTLVVVTFLGVVMIAVVGMWWQRRRLRCIAWWDGADISHEAWDGIPGAGPVKFSYQFLVQVTDNFSHPIGEGGFGKVYKGWIGDQRGSPLHNVVAVKVLKQCKTDQNQLRAEIGTLSKIHHINLVSLLGFCIAGRHGQKKLLVYEYMDKGSLDRYLSPRHMQQPLPWSMRLSIAVGTARGIAYLHNECNPPILHCDIKPQNVLLDENFTPKVADFGFATRFCKSDQSHVTFSGVRGTRGYMAPEWLKSSGITSKADVYSFGILLLELVHGLNTTGSDHMSLIEWAFDCIKAGYMLHPDYEAASAHHDTDNEDEHLQSGTTRMQSSHEGQGEGIDEQQLHLLRIALWCVNHSPLHRLSMPDVLQLIEGSRAINDPPNPADAAFINIEACDTISSHIVSYSAVSGR